MKLIVKIDDPPNACLSNPCKNGATCRNYLSHFTCDCPQYYSGHLCDNCNKSVSCYFKL